ncbi:DNA cytosine methyltransferase [Flagellimonas eckloniae]|nr:DNA cytosine methyltransferase [Allomuricauda eckloniae]
MKQLSVFSGGCDGFSLAGKWLGWETIGLVENDPSRIKRLKKNFPKAPIFEDIKINNEYGEFDIISGGDPCQPHSNSGNRKGKSDPRYLWPEKFAIIRKYNPRYVVNENVFGTVSNGVLDQKINDLESVGYTCWPPIVIPASYVGAWHTRKRVWLVAYSPEERRKIILCRNSSSRFKANKPPITLDTQSNPFLQFEKSMGQPPIFGMDDGIPDRVDRLGMIGDSIVPQIAYKLFSVIDFINKSNL